MKELVKRWRVRAEADSELRGKRRFYDRRGAALMECADELEHALATEPPRTGWRGMETIPRDDNNEVLVGEIVVRFADSHECTVVVWDSYNLGWSDPEGACRGSDCFDAWSPLPDTDDPLVKEVEALRARVCTVADEAYGPFPVMTAEEALSAIERGHFEDRLLYEKMRTDTEDLRRQLAAAPNLGPLERFLESWDNWPQRPNAREDFRAALKAAKGER